MPPLVTEDDSSSAGDIPNVKGKGKGKGKGKAKAVDKDLDEEDQEEKVIDEEPEDLEEDEYVVEKILSHRFEADGTLKLQVRWQGWGPDADTWEPEDNLDGCPDEMAAYYEEIGGKPKFGGKGKGAGRSSTAGASSQSKKRKLSEIAAAQTPPPSSSARTKSRKKAKEDLETSVVEVEKPAKWQPPAGSWENEVISVETMEREEDGSIHAYLMFRDGVRSSHPSAVAHKKCPQKMLQFYEAHLQFTTPTSKSTKATNGTNDSRAGEEEQEEKVEDKDVEMSDEEEGIKGVASALA